MPTTLDPQEERQHLDELESNFSAPSARERKPVSADELEQQYNLPSARGRSERVYDDDGVEPSSPQRSKNEVKDSDELKQAEEAATDSPGSRAVHENQVGAGYREKGSSRGFIGTRLGKGNKAYFIGGGGVLATATIAIFIFLALAPLKIMHVVNNLQDHFYATSESAVQKESDVLFSTYVRTRVMPALKRCPGAVTKKCNPIEQGGLVSQLFNGWRNAGLEEKLAQNYGIEFKYVPYGNGHYYLKMPGMTGNGANLDSFVHPDQLQLFSLDEYLAKSNDPQFKKVSRSQLRHAYRDALAKETKWKQVLYRYKIAGLLSRKYGLKRCIIACDTRDNFADWKDSKNRAAKMVMIERVLAPRNERMALVLGCIMTGGCNDVTTDSDGRKETAVENRLQLKMAELAAQDTGKFAEVVAHSNKILADGYQKAALKAVTEKLLGVGLTDESAETALKAVPVIGWINAASTLTNLVENAPQEIKMSSYLINGGAMVSLFGTYRIYTDEIKSGNIDPAILGSFTDTLGPGQPGDIGGTASAEESPLYQNLIDGNNGSQAGSTLSNLFGESAYAASNNSKVVCADGKPIPTGKLVCSEEVLGGNASVIGALESIKNNAALKPVFVLGDFWNHTIGKVLRTAVKAVSDQFIGALEGIPGAGALINKIGSAVQPLIDAFIKFIVPSPFGLVRGSPDSNQSTQVSLVNKLISPVLAASDNQSSDYMTGGRVFDLMAGGADVSGNDYAHNGLGGQMLSAEQTATIINQQLQQNLEDYQSQPLMARLFDKNSEYSLVTKVAMAMPASKSGLLKSVASLFTNPIGKLGGIFGFLTNPMQAFAAGAAQPDPFGITQYGYSSNDPTLVAANKDPEKYWNQNCSSNGTTIDWKKPINAKWQDKGLDTAKTSTSGMPENTTTDPCLLLQATVASAGGIYDDSLLGADQPGADTSVSTDSTPLSSADATIDTANLFKDSSSVGCAPGTNDLGIQEGWTSGSQVPIRVCGIPGLPSGGEESTPGKTFYIKNANGLGVVNSRVSGAVLAMVQTAAKDGVKLSANSTFRTMAHQQSLCPCDGVHVAHPGYSNHQLGLAIDFSTLPSTPGPVAGNAFWDWLSKNAPTFGYKNYPKEAWHWSPTGN